MGRTVVADEQSQNYIYEVLKTGKWGIGLIIGQMTSQKDFAVKLIRTPEPAEDECSEEQESATPSKKRRKSKPESLTSMDEQWIALHAKQVTRMLPGGIDVIGLFVVAPPKMMQAAQSKLRQILFAIQKVLKRTFPMEDDQNITDRVLLQVCTETKKYTCRSLDVSNPKSDLRPAEWKVQTTGESWCKLQSCVSVNIHIHIPKKNQDQMFFKRIQSAILPYCQRIQDGVILIDDQLRVAQDPLDPPQLEGRRSKTKERNAITKRLKEVTFLTQLESSIATAPIIEDCCSRMTIKGCISCRAFVHSRSTVDEATRAIKSDFIRSLISRCELLSEDIDVVEEDTSVKELYDTPIRVFGSLPSSPIEFCDYVFQDEKIEEVIERIKELLDVSVTETDLDLSSEKVATEDDWSKAKNSQEEKLMSEVESGAHIRDIPVGAILGVIVLILAVVLYTVIS
ncbi:protein odr-4 homolog [Saccostrea echinata]|uniref:protein odr-4 homolog n=1 Tax=Saccostrea echinata TaxID=191078 RepID=UPI002A807F44|nr:protein odr-4 homolog [Saccostrea echinata]